MATTNGYTERDYTDFAHTGPGTLAGRYLRTFWQPVYPAGELPAGRAMPIRIMSEDFTLYRGEGGQPHLVDYRCAHRGTQLSTGWVEGDCIRCFYHGWKYDGSGQCVEQPAEDVSFASQVKIRSYPTQEYLGLIFAYLGDGGPPPLPRHLDFEREGVVDAGFSLQAYNYFQHLENSCDPVHVAFVHRNSEYRGLSGCPQVSVEETDYGMEIRALRSNGVRVTHCVMPAGMRIRVAPRTPETGWRDMMLWEVPVDDTAHRAFMSLFVDVTGEAAQCYWETPDWMIRGNRDMSEGEEVLAGKLRLDDVDHTLSNLINLQDYVAQRGQGIIADRNHERLGRADLAVFMLRRLWARELKALAAGRPLKQWRVPVELATTLGM